MGAMDVVMWIADNIFGEPAVLIGLIVLVGLLLQKKTANQIISGTFKAVIGFLIITLGADVISSALEVFEPLWAEVFNLESESFSNYMGQEAFNGKFGSAVALIMAIGFIINVLIARFSPFKYIYLTGHMMFWTTTIFAADVVQIAGEDVSFWGLVFFLSVIMGIYWALQPAVVQPYMRKITGNDNIALGHTSASVSLLSAWGGQLFGNKENDSEKIKVPSGLEFLRDSNVITALTMGLLFFVGALVVSFRDTEEPQSWWNRLTKTLWSIRLSSHLPLQPV